MTETTSCLYLGIVTHQRLMPKRHDLRYRIFSLFLNLNRVAELDAGSIWFGVNRPALLGFNFRDHGARDGSDPMVWVRQQLRDAGMEHAGEQINLLCFPRVLNYVFNPLSIYFCHEQDGRLGAVLYQVKNTFGEQHGYLFGITGQDRPLRHSCAKQFYVSPFIGMEAHYDFTLTPPDEGFSLFIRESAPQGEMLRAAWNGQRAGWSKATLQNCFWRFPLLTFQIIIGIHWHGLLIWLKNFQFFHRPPRPGRDITLTRNE